MENASIRNYSIYRTGVNINCTVKEERKTPENRKDSGLSTESKGSSFLEMQIISLKS